MCDGARGEKVCDVMAPPVCFLWGSWAGVHAAFSLMCVCVCVSYNCSLGSGLGEGNDSRDGLGDRGMGGRSGWDERKREEARCEQFESSIVLFSRWI
jgi:hypothetical protein